MYTIIVRVLGWRQAEDVCLTIMVYFHYICCYYHYIITIYIVIRIQIDNFISNFCAMQIRVVFTRYMLLLSLYNNNIYRDKNTNR
jgi:hypothetical protein